MCVCVIYSKNGFVCVCDLLGHGCVCVYDLHGDGCVCVCV